MYREEQPHLRALPAEAFRLFRQATRRVDDAGLVQVEGAYYAALPAAPHSEVTVRIYAREIEILDAQGEVLRRHPKSARKGAFVLEAADRLFNPSRETARLMRIGPAAAAFGRELFARMGRPGQRAIYGLANLPRRYAREDIEALCARLLAAQCVSYAALRRALARQQAERAPAEAPALTQSGPAIREISAYQRFWDNHSLTHPPEDTDADVDRRA